MGRALGGLAGRALQYRTTTSRGSGRGLSETRPNVLGTLGFEPANASEMLDKVRAYGLLQPSKPMGDNLNSKSAGQAGTRGDLSLKKKLFSRNLSRPTSGIGMGVQRRGFSDGWNGFRSCGAKIPPPKDKPDPEDSWLRFWRRVLVQQKDLDFLKVVLAYLAAVSLAEGLGLHRWYGGDGSHHPDPKAGSGPDENASGSNEPPNSSHSPDASICD